VVITIDISRCFDSIGEEQVATALQKEIGLDEELSRQLSKLVCYRGSLAQGYPTSSLLCNLVLLKPLADISSKLNEQNIRVGSYVDDIAVSGSIKDPGAIINQAAITLSRSGLRMERSKTLVMPASKRQVICGLTVNKKLALSRELKIELLSGASRNTVGRESLMGWVANARAVDPTFAAKLESLVHRRASDEGPKPIGRAAA
jgi:RNA-directed DNA polymerase